MYISLTNSSANGFKKWSDAQRPNDDDDGNLGETAPVTITEPLHDDRKVIEESPHHP